MQRNVRTFQSQLQSRCIAITIVTYTTIQTSILKLLQWSIHAYYEYIILYIMENLTAHSINEVDTLYIWIVHTTILKYVILHSIHFRSRWSDIPKKNRSLCFFWKISNPFPKSIRCPLSNLQREQKPDSVSRQVHTLLAGVVWEFLRNATVVDSWIQLVEKCDVPAPQTGCNII